MSKIIFVEGVPGSGKSTVAKKISEILTLEGKEVRLFNEGDLHPIDLAWCSIIPKEEFVKKLKQFEQYEDQINSFSKELDGNVITAYTKVRVADEDVNFYREFEQYEIYRTDDYFHFKNTHLELWTSFEKEAEDVYYVFECVFLQNHINELLLKFNVSKPEIMAYFQSLISPKVFEDALIIYLNPSDLSYSLDRVIEERRTDKPDVYKDWIELVYDYMGSTKHGETLGYIGKDGFLRYLEDRRALELEVLEELRVISYIYNVKDNYDEVLSEIKKAIL